MNVFLSKTHDKPDVYRLFTGPFFYALENELDGRSDPKLNPDAIPLLEIFEHFRMEHGGYTTVFDRQGSIPHVYEIVPEKHQKVNTELNTLCDAQLFAVFDLFVKRAHQKFKLFGIKNPPFDEWTRAYLRCFNRATAQLPNKGIMFIHTAVWMMAQYFYVRQACLDGAKNSVLYKDEILGHYPNDAQSAVMITAIQERLRRKYG